MIQLGGTHTFGGAFGRRRFRRTVPGGEGYVTQKFPAGCKGAAEVKASYRFLDNEHVTFLSISGPHHDATIERIREQPVVLIPQDTTELDLTRPHEIMVGAGPLRSNDSARLGFHAHVSLAMTPVRRVLGVVHVKIFARDPVAFEKGADQMRAERRAKSVVEDRQCSLLTALD